MTSVGVGLTWLAGHNPGHRPVALEAPARRSLAPAGVAPQTPANGAAEQNGAAEENAEVVMAK